MARTVQLLRHDAYCPINCPIKAEIRAVDSQSDLTILLWLWLLLLLSSSLVDADRQTHGDSVFSFILRYFSLSLRSKRFRSVSEQKETVEGDFRFWSFYARSLTLVPRSHSRPQSPSFLGHVVGYKLSRVALGTRMPRSLLLNRTETLATQATVNLMRLRHYVHR